MFGSGAGARVKEAMGRRRESIEGVGSIRSATRSYEEDLPDQAKTLNHIPKFAKRRIRVDEPELKDI